MDPQYDELARKYPLLLTDPQGTSEQLIKTLTDTLHLDLPKLSILDCACGTGIELAYLAKLSGTIAGSDQSAGMLMQAREHLESQGLSLPLIQCKWTQLPNKITERFDLVLCTGNSISHCQNSLEMDYSIGGMAEMLTHSGTLAVSLRNWEQIVKDNPRYWVMRSRLHGGKRVTPVYVWNLQGMNKTTTVDILFIEDNNGDTSFEVHTLTMRPFPRQQLTKSFRKSGLSDIQVIPDKNGAWYWVTARKA
jgi:SAM-dependent methyltransferase